MYTHISYNGLGLMSITESNTTVHVAVFAIKLIAARRMVPSGVGTADPNPNRVSPDQDHHHFDERNDRQIRLWGIEAQNRLSSSKILYSGMTGAAAETAKNLVLAGVHAVVQDSAMVKACDLGANFLLTTDDIGRNRAEASAVRFSP